MIINTFKETRQDKRLKELEVIERAKFDVNVFSRYCLGIKNKPGGFHEYMNSIIDSDRQYITLDAPVASGKTTTVELVRPLFELGHNPHHMMALVSVSPDLPRRCLGVIRKHIEENERLHRVFPDLKMEESTKAQITVKRKRSMAKDASIVGIGIEGAILGRRWTYLITDDILRLDTTTSDTLREKVWHRLIREILPRLNKNAKHLDIGTPWVTNDARHQLRKLPQYLYLRFDGETGNVHDLNGKIIHTFEGGLWPETVVDPITGFEFGLSKERLAALRDSMPGHEYQRQIRCMSLSGAMNVFADVDHALKMGQGIELKVELRSDGMRRAWRQPEPSWRRVFTGVDLAIDRKSTSDDTAFFTGAYEERRRHVLELRRGKIEAPDIIRNMIDIVRSYPLHHLGFMVESNLAQRYLLDLVKEPGILKAMGAKPEEIDRIRVYPHITSSNKTDEGIGIRAMAVEFEQKRWPIPSIDGTNTVSLVQEWIDGLRNYDPVAHSDDMVIASWLFWEMTRDVGAGESDWGKFGIFVP